MSLLCRLGQRRPSDGRRRLRVPNCRHRIVARNCRHRIARAQLSLVERAYAAADLHKGNVLLVQPTVLQSAALYRVNPTYVHCALKRPNDRKLVESGAVPFTLPVVKALPAPVSPQQRLADVVAEVGVTGTLNMLAVLDKDGQLAA